MTGLVEAILAVFSSIGSWIVTTITSFVPIFWTAGTSGGNGSLTFMGVLALMSLGIGLVLLLIRIVQNFITFRA